MGQDDQTPTQLEVLNEQLVELQKEFQAGEQQIADVKEKIANAQNDANAFNEQMSELTTSQTELQTEITDVQTKIAAIATAAVTDVETQTTNEQPVVTQAANTSASTDTTATSGVVETETSQITISDITEIDDASVDRVKKAMDGKDSRHILHAIKPNFPNLKTNELATTLNDMREGLSFHIDIVTAIENLPASEA